MDSAKLLKYWHLTGLAVAAIGGVAIELQPLTASYPHVGKIVAGVGAISVAFSLAMDKLAKDKVVAAIINDPSGPTPQGFGIPKPTAPWPLEADTTAKVAAEDPAAIKAVQDSAMVKNVVQHAQAVLENQK